MSWTSNGAENSQGAKTLETLETLERAEEVGMAAETELWPWSAVLTAPFLFPSDKGSIPTIRRAFFRMGSACPSHSDPVEGTETTASSGVVARRLPLLRTRALTSGDNEGSGIDLKRRRAERRGGGLEKGNGSSVICGDMRSLTGAETTTPDTLSLLKSVWLSRSGKRNVSLTMMINSCF